MLGETITITINAVAKVLSRVNDSEPYSATYFLAETNDEYTVSVKHTVPPTRGASKESHLFRLDHAIYDGTSGELVTKQSTWTVMETSLGRQDSVGLEDDVLGVAAYLDTTNVGKILARES